MIVQGVDLDRLKEPMSEALYGYALRTGAYVSFDVATATQLEYMPGKPNSARSQSIVKLGGEAVAVLWAIAFATGDATGDASRCRPEQLNFRDGITAEPKHTPRTKGCVAETHLTLVTQSLATSQSDPRLFAGRLGELGLVEPWTVGKIGNVGQNQALFNATMAGEVRAEPLATLTCGSRNGLWSGYGERFGDPHAIVNDQPDTLQICGFIAVDTAGLEVLRELRALEQDFSAS